MLTVADAKAGLSSSVTLRAPSTTVGTCSGAVVGPAVVTTTGATVTVKLVAEKPGPLPLVTVMTPVVAPLGTFTVSCVGESTVKPGATVPLNVTLVVPVKEVPVSTTLVPTGPLAGAKRVRVGGVKGVRKVNC